MAAIIAGEVEIIMASSQVAKPLVEDKRIKALAVTGKERSPALPDVPALGEFLPGYEATGWQGICAPRNTPAEIVDRLNNEINAALTSSGIKAQLANLYGSPLSGSPRDFGKLIEREAERWGKRVEASQH